MSVSRGDAPDQRSARVGVHEDQTILVAAQRLQGFRSGWYISEPGTLKKHESLSARAGSVRDVDNGNGGSERAGPPSGGPVRSIRKNIVLPAEFPVPVLRTSTTGRTVTFTEQMLIIQNEVRNHS